MDETLAQLTRRRLDELGLGMREAVRNQADIGPWDLSQICRGKQVNITEPKARALARAMKVPVEAVRAAREYSLTSKPLELPGRLNRLTPAFRQALVAVGDALLDVQEKPVTPAEPAADTPARTAAVPARRKRGT